MKRQNHITITLLKLHLLFVLFMQGCTLSKEEQISQEDEWENSFSIKIAYASFFESDERIDFILDSLQKDHQGDTMHVSFAIERLLVAKKNYQDANIEDFFSNLDFYMSHPRIIENPEYLMNGILCKIGSTIKYEEKSGLMDLLEKGNEILPKIANPYLQMKFKSSTVHIYFTLIQHNTALSAAYEVLSEYKQVIANASEQQKVYIAIDLIDTYNVTALILNELKKFEEAKAHLLEALSFANEFYMNSSDKKQIYVAKTYNNLSIVSEELGEINEAVDYLQKAMEINKNMNGSKMYLVTNYYNLAIYQTKLALYDEAISNFRTGVNICKDIGFTPGLGYHYYGLGDAYSKMGLIDSAEWYFNQSEIIVRQFDNKPILANVVQNLSEIKEKQGLYKQALAYEKERFELEKLYQEFVLNRDTEELTIKHKVEQTNAANDFLSKELALQQNISEQQNLLVITLLSIVCITFIFLFFLNRSKNKMIKMYNILNVQKDQINSTNVSLNELIKERDALVKTIVHDLRNPLASIQGFTHLLEAENSEEQKKLFLDMLHAASNQLDVLISSLLQTYSEEAKIETKSLKNINCKNFLDQITKGFEFEARFKNIELAIAFQDFECKTNQNALYSIYGNLLSNAIKFSPEQTKISVSSRQVDDGWTLTVRDQGPGFSEEDRTKMFEMFTTLSAFPTKNEMSTGIGLYSVRKTIEKLGGTITLSDTYSEGAEFTCFFPKIITDSQS